MICIDSDGTLVHPKERSFLVTVLQKINQYPLPTAIATSYTHLHIAVTNQERIQEIHKMYV